MAFFALGQLFKFARDTQDLYKLHETVKETLLALDGRLRAVENRLEAEQGQIITEAKCAATAAASMIASAVISDAVTRVTQVEEGMGRLSLPQRAVALQSNSKIARTRNLHSPLA